MNFAHLPGLAVLNPSGHDPDQSFAEGLAGPHPPVNYHAFAACSGGSFYRRSAQAARHRSVLLLLRGDCRDAATAFRLLKTHGCFVALAFKEAGTAQVAQQLAAPSVLRRFRRLAGESDLCLATTPDLIPLFAAVSRQVHYLPTPYPMEYPEWDFAAPVETRAGLLIGTREFHVPSRNHLLVLAAVRKMPVPITVINPAGRKGAAIIRSFGFPAHQIQVSPGLPYREYLHLIARHRLILQFDESRVPGQVAGDGLLCRVPTVGGNGAIERIAWPDLNGVGRDFTELLGLAGRLLKEDDFYRGQIARVEEIATRELSFSAMRAKLRQIFPGIAAEVAE